MPGRSLGPFLQAAPSEGFADDLAISGFSAFPAIDIATAITFEADNPLDSTTLCFILPTLMVANLCSARTIRLCPNRESGTS